MKKKKQDLIKTIGNEGHTGLQVLVTEKKKKKNSQYARLIPLTPKVSYVSGKVLILAINLAIIDRNNTGPPDTILVGLKIFRENK